MKAFLTRNKIYFETILIVSLTVMSILVSITANIISHEQVLISQKALKPIINVELNYKEYDSRIVESINVYNTGATLGDFKVLIWPYFYVRAIFSDANDESFTLDSIYEYKAYAIIVPISYPNNYEIEYKNTRDGLICNIRDSASIKDFIEDINSFNELNNIYVEKAFNNEYKLKIEMISLNYILDIKYSDMLGRENQELYNCYTGYLSIDDELSPVPIDYSNITSILKNDKLYKILRGGGAVYYNCPKEHRWWLLKNTVVTQIEYNNYYDPKKD